ncbi:hypothetical protein [Longispora albida]|uniref:hypothetical protein n=1 Tax=Longispora albida TaxID=203523 RepID=UPI000378DF86|nr:hypothetical protein [Longispora albida]
MPTRIARALVTLVAAALLGLTGTAAASPAPAAPPAPASQATLHQTGGFAGVDRTIVVLPWIHPEAPGVLNRAASPGFRALAPAYQPLNPCCDLFTYEVTVTYADGTAKTVTVTDGAQDVPPLLTDVIESMLRIGDQTGQ